MHELPKKYMYFRCRLSRNTLFYRYLRSLEWSTGNWKHKHGCSLSIHSRSELIYLLVLMNQLIVKKIILGFSFALQNITIILFGLNWYNPIKEHIPWSLLIISFGLLMLNYIIIFLDFKKLNSKQRNVWLSRLKKNPFWFPLFYIRNCETI